MLNQDDSRHFWGVYCLLTQIFLRVRLMWYWSINRSLLIMSRCATLSIRMGKRPAVGKLKVSFIIYRLVMGRGESCWRGVWHFGESLEGWAVLLGRVTFFFVFIAVIVIGCIENMICATYWFFCRSPHQINYYKLPYVYVNI